MYQLTNNPNTIIKTDIGKNIPVDVSNIDYVEYLAWIDLGNTPTPYTAPTPTISECLLKIDADVDAIYGAVLGNRAQEYSLASTEAQTYKAAGYTGTVPGSVQSWAIAKGWTAAQATDDILATAAQWVGAQSAIRAARLARKEQIRATTNDAASRLSVMTAWNQFVSYIRGQLGIP